MIETFRALRRELRAQHIDPASVTVTLGFINESDRWQAARTIGEHFHSLARTPAPSVLPIYTGSLLEIPFTLVVQRC